LSQSLKVYIGNNILAESSGKCDIAKKRVRKLKPCFGLVSLMEIIKVFANDFVQKAIRLGVSIEKLGDDDIWEDDEHRMMLTRQLSELSAMCEENELPVTKISIDEVIICFKQADDSSIPLSEGIRRNFNSGLLAKYLSDIRERLVDELSTKLFFQVPHSRKHYFDEPMKGWEEIIERFPGCTSDVEEMNKCFALSRYTASMFHAMHVAEWGAINLGDHIGVTDPVKGWGATTKQLAKLVGEGRSKFPSLKVTFEVVEMLNQEINTMKLAWRHKIDHAANHLIILPNVDFTPDIAEHTIKSVKVFMSRIMEGTK